MMQRLVLVLAVLTALICWGNSVDAAYVTTDLVVEFDASDADGLGNPIASSTDTSEWYNQVGNANDGIYIGLAGDFTTTGVGSGTSSDPYAMQFDGTDDALKFTNLLNLGSTSFTYEFWLKADPTMGGTWARGALIGEYVSGNNSRTKDFVQLTTPSCSWLNSGVQYDQYPGSGDSSFKQVGGLPSDEWYQLVVTKDIDTLTFYVNGVEFSHGTNNEVYTGDACDVGYIGKREGQVHYFKGLMGLVRVYDEPLDYTEVLQNFYNDNDVFDVEVGVDPNVRWNVAGPAAWSVGSNWNSGTAPGSSNYAHVNNGGACYVDTSEASSTLTVGNLSTDSGSIEIRSGGALTTGLAHIGREGAGSLTLQAGGAFVATDVLVGTHGTSGSIVQNGGTANVVSVLIGDQTDSLGFLRDLRRIAYHV